MKVYLAWNYEAYYGPQGRCVNPGPHPVGNLVYATLDAAKRAVESDKYCTKGGQWKQRNGSEPPSWEYTAGSYYIEEVEPEA